MTTDHCDAKMTHPEDGIGDCEFCVESRPNEREFLEPR